MKLVCGSTVASCVLTYSRHTLSMTRWGARYTRRASDRGETSEIETSEERERGRQREQERECVCERERERERKSE